MSERLKTLHIVVKGSVQGIGFRATTKHLAEKYHIRGSVKNLRDGSVEIYAQGFDESLDQFIERVKREEGLKKIDRISVEDYKSPKAFNSFDIIF